MANLKKRKVFKKGHRRKFLVIYDGTEECEVALFFAARLAKRTKGALTLLHVIEPAEFSRWSAIKTDDTSEQEARTAAAFKTFRKHLPELGFKGLKTESMIRKGNKADEVMKLIKKDEDIAVLVLAASLDAKGPGPLISSLASGDRAGTFPVPIYIVPGAMTLDDIEALA